MGRPVHTSSGAIERTGVGSYTNWRERVWGKLVEATPGWPERDDLESRDSFRRSEAI
jgi:hypothetical protein